MVFSSLPEAEFQPLVCKILYHEEFTSASEGWAFARASQDVLWHLPKADVRPELLRGLHSGTLGGLVLRRTQRFVFQFHLCPGLKSFGGKNEEEF